MAHAVGGGQFPVPLWAIGYGAAAILVLLALALRSAWPASRLAAAADRSVLIPAAPFASRALVTVGRIVAALLWAVTATAAFVGPDDNAENITRYAVLWALFLGGIALSLVAGDVWRAVNPLDTLALLVFGGRLPDRTDRTPPAWTAAAGLATFAWITTAFHLRISPRALGAWLVAYTALALAGAAAWGRTWLREGEGFAVLFGLLARVSPWRRDEDGRLRLGLPVVGVSARSVGPSPRGVLGVALVAIAIPLFDAARLFRWWTDDIVGDRGDWPRTAVHTLGLAFTAAAVALVWLAATRAAARTVPDDSTWTPALLVLLAGLLVARYAVPFAVEAANFVALLSDPYARGWNLLGTIRWLPPFWVPGSSLFAWIEVLALVVGGALAVLVAHDRALAATTSRRLAATAVLPVQGAIIALTVVGIGLVLGG